MSILGSLVLALLAAGRRDPPDRDFRCVALSSPSIRHQLIVAPELENEVVLVPERLTEMDVKALAESLHADVESSGDDRWRLLRRSATATTLRKADQDWIQAERQLVVARSDRLFLPYAKSPDEAPLRGLQAARERFEARPNRGTDFSGSEANELTPAARFLTDLLRHRSASELDKVAPGGMAVFSNAPVGSERALTVPKELLASYETAQARFAERSMGAIDAGRIPDQYRWVFPTQPFLPGARTLQLYVRREGTEPAYGLQIYDPEGRREAGATLTLRGSEDGDAPAIAKKGKLGKATLPPDARSVLEEATQVPIDPEVRDPLDLATRDALLLWAKGKGSERIVACVPDALLDDMKRCISDDGRLDLDALTSALARNDCEVIASGKTLVVRPAHPLSEEAARVDRRPLGSLFRAAARGSFGLADLLAYHAAYAETYGYRPILQRMERPIFDAFGLMAHPSAGLPHPLLALIGTLDSAGKRILAGGGRSQLSASAQANLLAEILRLGAPPRGGRDLDKTMTRRLAAMGNPWLEALPQTSAVLIRRISKADGKVLDSDFTSLYMLTKNRPESISSLAEANRFLWAEERTIPVRIVFDDGTVAGPFALRDRVLKTKNPVPLEDIPGLKLGATQN